MATRPIFMPSQSIGSYVEKYVVEFEWFPGFSIEQKQRSIRSLHDNARSQHEIEQLLEISSKSPHELGIKLSAFELTLKGPKEKPIPIECAFQGSKVFEEGGPFNDLFGKSPRQAKKDPRLKESGELLRFEFMNAEWPLQPKTLFYDWLYLQGLRENKEFAVQTLKYDAFTDIEYNPKKSFNCQAHSAALYVSLVHRGLFKEAVSSIDQYKDIIISTLIEGESRQYPLFQ